MASKSTVNRPIIRIGGKRSFLRLPLHSILLLPAIAVLLLVILYPLVSSAILSFFHYNLTDPLNHGFVGTDNFTKLAHDGNFWLSLKNTLVFTFASVIISLLVGLIVAIAVDQLPEKYSGFTRGLILAPWIIPAVVVAYLFMYIFDVEVGLANFILQQLHIIKEYLPWLMRGDLAMTACVIANCWNQIPFYILMFAAGLKTIPQDVKEATLEMGANRWQEFWHVTLPYLRGIIVITSLLQIIRNLNNFPIIYTMTGGGPAYETTTLVVYIYRLAFENFELGYSAAVALSGALCSPSWPASM
ncbi:carbohydrate ABC transporter permease [Desulforamulus ruminis]|uniref:carbohydrate ABC transporter permease n=1 Tax=Desulforamulus ruminis TaxID=1564 RepID=UPI002355653E|nr:sugar ABC transporter permease [Desulforamulus ruminis]